MLCVKLFHFFTVMLGPSIYYFTIILTPFSIVRAIYLLVTVVKKIKILNNAKDFDIYYFAVLVLDLCICLSFWHIFFGYESPEIASCSVAVIIFVCALSGSCYLQIAINWLEVAGKFNSFVYFNNAKKL